MKAFLIFVLLVIRKTGVMGIFGTKEATGLRELFIAGLRDIYWAEEALVPALQEMQEKATEEELRTAIEEHVVETKTHIARLDEVFAKIGEKPEGKKCKAMEGILAEAEAVTDTAAEGVVRDAAIIACSQKVEHYEIASYGTLAAYARALGEQEIRKLLEETLAEEKETDQILTDIAESVINNEAAHKDLEE